MLLEEGFSVRVPERFPRAGLKEPPGAWQEERRFGVNLRFRSRRPHYFYNRFTDSAD